MCDDSYNVKRQRDLVKTANDVLGATDMNDLCDLAKKLIKSGGYGQVICSTIQLSL